MVIKIIFNQKIAKIISLTIPIFDIQFQFFLLSKNNFNIYSYSTLEDFPQKKSFQISQLALLGYLRI